jgi:mono/diheme cytochrome c family protein
MPSIRAQSTLAGLTLLFLIHYCPSTAAIDFLRDIQPIFAEHCAQCHGVDEKTRAAELRLDIESAALRGGESGKPAIVPGKPDESELMRRIQASDTEILMPPPDHKKPLSAKQVEAMRQWIAAGAKYEAHWSFTVPQKTELPDVNVHPVDAWVKARLAAEGLALSPSADSATLCRRIYLDLIGLPPSPVDLAEFERQGANATIEQLLSSDRFGEKWARIWMDAARYSDTNGYEKDLKREQWKWRDWVIDAFNRDLPYDQFIIEQIAGDLLPDPTPSQIIATGYLRNSMINEEGAIIPEQFRMTEMFDRIDCIGKSILGLTTQCAQCHSHKFDPLTQTEYYGMFAFLNNSYEARSWVYTPEQQQQIADIKVKITESEANIRSTRPNWQTELTAWEQALLQDKAVWEPLKMMELGSVSGLNHPTQEHDASILMLGHTSADVFFIAQPDLRGVTGMQLEALNHRDLPHNGPGRSNLGTWIIQELEVLTQTPDSKEWVKQKLVNASADYSNAEQKDADGKNGSGPVAFLIDGKDEFKWKSDRGVGIRNQPSVAVVQFEKPLELPEGTQFKIVLRMGDMLGCCRISLTRSANPSAPTVDHHAMLALYTPTTDRTEEQTGAIFSAWRSSVAELKPINQQIATWRSGFPQAPTSVLHMFQREPHNARTTHLLDRGAWDKPLTPVQPHVPSSMHAFGADLPKDRLGFAKWLVDPRSPLTSRVAVNRVWQSVFGIGLVETSEDFGTRAAVPAYRELLDWLAVDFMQHGWSHKRLLRQIMTSATYQQRSTVSQELWQRDPRNTLIARGPRFRVDAEVVRDIALVSAGLMTHQMGGPSVIPPVPQNVLDYNYVYPDYWKPAEGPQRYRRAVYGFRKRSMPDPVMSSFDAPNADFSCVRRVRSNTPLAALTGMNETVFVEAARALALRVLREASPTEFDRIDYIYKLCTARTPSDAQRKELLAMLATQRKRLAEGWLNAKEVATGDAGTLPELPTGTTPQDAAVWTLVARVILNLDETISKN